MASVRGSLSEVLIAQGYQDLSGQIIRGVMNLVAELESALGQLVRLAGNPGAIESPAAPAAPAAANGAHAAPAERNHQGNGHGPVVPGIGHQAAAVSGQQDVDALLAALGM